MTLNTIWSPRWVLPLTMLFHTDVAHISQVYRLNFVYGIVISAHGVQHKLRVWITTIIFIIVHHVRNLRKNVECRNSLCGRSSFGGIP